jgi:preprotein translocase subunit YajC
MSKLTTWGMISLLILLPFAFVGCVGCEDEVKPQQVQAQQKEDSTNQFYENDKVTIKVQTSSGEKSYDGTLVRWWKDGVTIKTDSERTLLAIAAQSYTVEKQIPR